MEFIVIKVSDSYIRVRAEKYELCSMEKASVFPMEKIEQVKDRVIRLRNMGLKDVHMFKLTITEDKIEI